MNILEWLSKDLELSEQQLFKFIKSAPHKYKRYRIPKRNGQGTREIAQPSRQVKYLQKLVYKSFFDHLPVHEAAHAYQTQRGIKSNARAHLSGNHLAKLDFSNFFPSIKPADFLKHIEKHSGQKITQLDEQIVERLFFYKSRSEGLQLSIGAPTSPAISNTIMFEFDQIISLACSERSVVYTRYADDLAFSGKSYDSVSFAPQIVEESLEQISYPRLRINKNKTVIVSKNKNRHVTGLVLTNHGTISIGRHNKRKIKALVHQYKTNKIEESQLAYLKGYLSYCLDVEPNFIQSLREKYGKDFVNSLMTP